MELDVPSALKQVRSLVDAYRELCLWYLRVDYYPETIEDALRVLRAIESHGDLAAFQRAAALRQWFLQHSNEMSAG